MSSQDTWLELFKSGEVVGQDKAMTPYQEVVGEQEEDGFIYLARNPPAPKTRQWDCPHLPAPHAQATHHSAAASMLGEGALCVCPARFHLYKSQAPKPSTELAAECFSPRKSHWVSEVGVGARRAEETMETQSVQGEKEFIKGF